MQRRFVLLALIAIAPALGCASSGSGTLPEDATPTQIFAAAESAREAGDLSTAADLYERVYEDYPAADEAVAAQWLAAELAYERGDWSSARTAYQKFHEANPMQHIGEIENRMYNIGEALYAEGMSGLFGLGIFKSREQSVKTMLWISDNLPKGSQADDALMFAARARLELAEEEDAILYLEQIINDYPESEWRLEARYLLGTAHLNMNRGPRYDLGALIDSRKAFARYIDEVEADPVKKMEYADRVVQARANIEEIDSRLAEKNLIIADYYLSVERPEAAQIYLHRAAEKYPSTEAGRSAASRLESLRTGAE